MERMLGLATEMMHMCLNHCAHAIRCCALGLQAEARHRGQQQHAPAATAVVLSPHVAHCAALRTRLAPFLLHSPPTMTPQEYGRYKEIMDTFVRSPFEEVDRSAEKGGKEGTQAQPRVSDNPRRFIRLVDTVEKLQGQEADIVIYSACASNGAALSKAGDFYANLRRTNVAFTRSKQRLIVVASRAMLSHAPLSVELYNEVRSVDRRYCPHLHVIE